MMSTTTVTVSRKPAGPVGQGGMFDPWADDSGTVETVAVVASGVPASIVSAKAATQYDDGVRERYDWRLIVAVGTDVRSDDLVLDETTGHTFTVGTVWARGTVGVTDHVAADLMRAVGPLT